MIRFLNAVPFLLGVGSGVGLLLCGRIVRSTGRFGELALWGVLTALWVVLWVRTFTGLRPDSAMGSVAGSAIRTQTRHDRVFFLCHATIRHRLCELYRT